MFSGIGRVRERRLWERGVTDWDALQWSLRSKGAGRLEKEICDAEDRYRAGDASYFYDALAPAERWRMLEAFSDCFAFIDVELDGWGRYSRPTMVGILRGGRYRCLVRGVNLNREELSKALEGAGVAVTFNGRRHDMHYISTMLGHPAPWLRTIDLRHIARQAGFPGGLKEVERATGVERLRHVELGAAGQSVRLWHLWSRKGSRGARRLLEEYNREDTCNMLPIALRLGSVLKERIAGNVS